MSTFLVNYSSYFLLVSKVVFYFCFFSLIYSIFSRVQGAASRVVSFKVTMGVIVMIFGMGIYYDIQFKKIENKVLTLKFALSKGVTITNLDKNIPIGDQIKSIRMDIMKMALISPIDPIRLELAKNRNTPEEILKIMTTDKTKDVRDYSLANLQRRGMVRLDALQYQYSWFMSFLQDRLSMISLIFTIFLILFVGRIPFLIKNRWALISLIVANMIICSSLEGAFAAHDQLRDYTLEYAIEHKTVTENDIGQWIVMANPGGLQFFVTNRRNLPTGSLKLLLAKEEVSPGLKTLVKKELIARNEYPAIEDENLSLPFQNDQNFNSL